MCPCWQSSLTATAAARTFSTAREYEVARLAAAGLRNGEIAARLMVTENTVRFHLRTIFQKLDIDRRAKLAERLKIKE
ncbi:MAG: response regulator transcription factor [Patescibacteria group bacterium]